MSYVAPSMKDALKDHVLEQVLAAKKFKAWYMKKPGEGRIMSTLFIFTPEGIAICGDLCPGGPKNQGLISNFGYGVGWFTGILSEGYLCEKFLRREWQSECAIEWIKEHIQEIEKGNEEEKPRLEEYKELQSSLEGGEMDSTRFHDALVEIGYEVEDEGFDYPRNTAGWLCALQQRFADLYTKMYADHHEVVAWKPGLTE